MKPADVPDMDGTKEDVGPSHSTHLGPFYAPVGVQDAQQGQQAVEQVVVRHRLAQHLRALHTAGAEY